LDIDRYREKTIWRLEPSIAKERNLRRNQHPDLGFLAHRTVKI
jgi:hypothetical protein